MKKKFLKGNQTMVYIIALMLVVAGYLSYSNNNILPTNADANTTKVGDIGDATFVSSNDVVTNETNNSISNNSTNEKNETKNTANATNNTASNNTTDTASTVSTNSNDYFVKSKMDRDNMYSQMLETYDKVLNSSNSTETQKQSATDEINKINQEKNSIMICENLISTKGFDKNIVFVNGESINAIIGTSTLEKEQVAQIQNILQREMKAEAKNIHIATK